jgi:micrococcal nuclease
VDDPYIRRCWLIRVIDGDTIDVVIDLGWDMRMNERVRLFGVNAPEIRGPEKVEGQRYKKLVEDWFLTHPVSYWLHSREYKRDSFGRTLAVIVATNGDSLNDFLNTKLT